MTSIKNKINSSLIIIAIVPILIFLILNNFLILSTVKTVQMHINEFYMRNTKLYIEGVTCRLNSAIDKSMDNYEIFEYMKEKNKGWFENNLVTLASQANLDMIIALDNDKQVLGLFGLSEKPGILDFNNNGIFKHHNDLYIITPKPIFKNSIDDKKGTLIVGQKITTYMLKELEEMSGNKFFLSYDGGFLPGSMDNKNIESLIRLFMSKNKSNIISIDNKTVMSSLPLSDISFGSDIFIHAVVPDIFLHPTTVNLQKNTILLLVFISVLIYFLSRRLNEWIIKPIRDLEYQIEKMSESKSLRYVDVDGPCEITALAQSFNKMSNQLYLQKEENENLRTSIEYEKLKTEFLANISHELRTPLNIILGAIQLIDLQTKSSNTDTCCSSSIQKYQKIMRQNCYRLLRLINNIIDVSKIHSESFDLHMKNYDLVSLIKDIVASVSEYVSIKELSIEFTTNKEQIITACDPDQIERILLNLLSNAIKFSSAGGKISVAVEEKEDRVAFSVADTGIGIPESQVNLIFERFKQVDSSLTRNHEGSGIGLSLVKSLVELQGGTISITSEKGKGSCFTVELPLMLLPETDDSNDASKLNSNWNRVERVSIEFSDIYSDY